MKAENGEVESARFSRSEQSATQFTENVRIMLELHGKSTDYSQNIVDAFVYLLCSKLYDHKLPKPCSLAGKHKNNLRIP